MPNYKGHLVGGFVAYLLGVLMVVTFFFKPSLMTGAEWLLFTLVGSLFPDIDTKSKGQKIFYRIFLVFQAILLFQKKLQLAVILGIAALIPLLVKHRGLCHNALFVLVIPGSVLLYFALFLPRYTCLVMWDTFFFILGAFSHLFLDRGFRRMLKV